jgi:hypothetical protein
MMTLCIARREMQVLPLRLYLIDDVSALLRLRDKEEYEI